MRFLRLKPTTIPVNFVFVDPDTGYRFTEATREALVKSIVTYRALNELEPIEHLDKVLENYWGGLPENIEAAEVGPEMDRGFLTYIKGGVALLQYVFFGEANMVDQAIAESRAKQCASCRFNVFPDKGPFVHYTDTLAEAMVGKDKRTQYHEYLGNCAPCTCTLKAKVWKKGDMHLSDAEKEKVKLVDCWQLKS